MNDIIIWDAGKDVDGRYTISCKGIVTFVVNNDNTHEILPEVDIAWMDKNQKRITIEELPQNIKKVIEIIKGKAQNV